MNLPVSTRLTVALFGLGGLGALLIAADRVAADGFPGGNVVAVAATFGVLLAATWVWPLVVYVDDESEAFNLDESFFVLLVLLVPGTVTLFVFAAATIAAQIVKRRSLVKSLFNVGQITVAVGVGLLVVDLARHGSTAMGYPDVAEALAGTLTYSIVNNSSVALLLRTLGTPMRKTLLGAFDVKVLVVLSSISVAIPIALLVSRDTWNLPIAIVPLLLLRHLGAGHFYARHDRARLRGLFEATLEVSRSMGEDETRDAILSSARGLLRSPAASLTPTPPTEDTLSARVGKGEESLWLAVSGRSRTEPFDQADRALLDALASVGANALANTALYEEVQRQKENLSLITDSLGEGVCAVNHEGEVTFMNPAAQTMLGWRPGDHATPGLKASAPLFLLAPALRSMGGRRTLTNYDTPFKRDDGTVFPVTMTVSPIIAEDEAKGAVIVFRDISERKAIEEQLARQAFHDSLTGLPNRRLLLDHLDHALARAKRTETRLAVIFCDVDRFKIVNDSLGHQSGDELLGVIAERLAHAIRPGDMLARFGGDEFIILLEDVESHLEPTTVSRRIMDSMRQPISLSGGHEIVATMSAGIALSDVSMSRDDLLHDADVAMYQAKERGRLGSFEVFDVEAMGMRSAERLDLESGLRRAIERGELDVHYQPLVSLRDYRPIGAEALVRWHHPDRGLLSPAEFIQLAEDTGLILPIGKAVLERACAQARTWKEHYGVALEVGVNLSARQFQQLGLVDQVEEVLDTTGVDPTQLCLEITESLAMDDVLGTAAILKRLRGLGVRVAIDDFGTGFSSLGYLARFPIDVVKVDKSFVDDIDTDPVKAAIVSAVVNLCEAIGATTVVEGVETLSQLELVRSLGCAVGQGFYFAPPMAPGELEVFLDLGTNTDEAWAVAV